MRFGRQTRAVLAPALALWTSACYAYAPAPLGPALGEHREVRVRADEPFPLRAPGAPHATALCLTRELRGRVVRVIADTLVLEITEHRIEPQSGTDTMPGCPERGQVAVVVAADVQVMSNRLDAPRTLAGLMAFGAIAILLMDLLFSAQGWGCCSND